MIRIKITEELRIIIGYSILRRAAITSRHPEDAEIKLKQTDVSDDLKPPFVG